MSKFKPYLIVIALMSSISAIHFFSMVYTSKQYDAGKGAYSNKEEGELLYTRTFTGESLSDLFGMDYSKFIQVDKVALEAEGNNKPQILLNDVPVTIRAISKKGDISIVYVLYQQDGEERKDKVVMNDELFGYKLSNVTNGVLTFERDDEVLNFTIFKTKKNDEGKQK